MHPLLILAALAAGGYYISRLAPRVATAAAASSAAAWSGQTTTLYQRYEGGFQETMTRREALLILGFDEGADTFASATEAEIKQRHRSLIKEMHSDAAGSSYIAAKINEARDVLLKAK